MVKLGLSRVKWPIEQYIQTHKNRKQINTHYIVDEQLFVTRLVGLDFSVGVYDVYPYSSLDFIFLYKFNLYLCWLRFAIDFD